MAWSHFSSAIHFQAQLLQAQTLQEIANERSFLGLHVLGGKPRHSGARFVIESRTVQADEETRVAVHFYDAFDSTLVEIHVLYRGQGHEAVGQKRDRIDARLEFPLVPAIVVFGGGEQEGIERLGANEVLVASFARKIAGQDGMIRLANQNKMIAVLLDDHGAALVRSDTHTGAPWDRRKGLGGGTQAKQFFSMPQYYAPTPGLNPAPSSAPSRPMGR